MRFMIIVKATAASEAGVMPDEKILSEMAKYHEELQEAGMLLDGSGVTDGPFTETKELIAGYTLIQAKSREEALEWTKRFPNPSTEGMEGEIEVRQLFELEDFEQGEQIERFRKMEMG